MLLVWYPPRVAGSEKDGIIRILAALLHLGNIEFTGESLSCRNGRQTATPNAQPDGPKSEWRSPPRRMACTLHCRAACRWLYCQGNGRGRRCVLTYAMYLAGRVLPGRT